jgi:hypothetical protein
MRYALERDSQGKGKLGWLLLAVLPAVVITGRFRSRGSSYKAIGLETCIAAAGHQPENKRRVMLIDQQSGWS